MYTTQLPQAPSQEFVSTYTLEQAYALKRWASIICNLTALRMAEARIAELEDN